MASSLRNRRPYTFRASPNGGARPEDTPVVTEEDVNSDVFRIRGTHGARSDGHSMNGSSSTWRGATALALQPSKRCTDLPTEEDSYRISKRHLDLVLSFVMLPMIAAVLLLVGALVLLTSGWPLFYRQTRIGQHGREFRIWKFRTMKANSDQVLAEYLRDTPEARREWQHTHKLRHDPRITLLGRFLRQTSLDELPQILNVLSGEMSLVGPRPIVHAEAVKYGERFPFYTAAVPGITGLWQVSGRCEVSYATRVKMDESYVRTWTLLQDLRILARTPRAVFCRHGAY